MNHRFVLAAAIAAALLVTACGSDVSVTAGEGDEPVEVEPDGGIGDTPAGNVPFFGGNDDQCPSITLANEADDRQRLNEAVDCFFVEYEAGIPVVLDVSLATVEGDPIYERYAYDGERVTIVSDTRLDTFGSGTVTASVCDDVKKTDWTPEGVGCAGIEHPGFPEAS